MSYRDRGYAVRRGASTRPARIKHVFHVNADGHAHTLTPQDQRNAVTAMQEANRYYTPDVRFGVGQWVKRGELTGPDPAGAMYQHYDWAVGVAA